MRLPSGPLATHLGNFIDSDRPLRYYFTAFNVFVQGNEVQFHALVFHPPDTWKREDVPDFGQRSLDRLASQQARLRSLSASEVTELVSNQVDLVEPETGIPIEGMYLFKRTLARRAGVTKIESNNLGDVQQEPGGIFDGYRYRRLSLVRHRF